jgi:hypothetical protein
MCKLATKMKKERATKGEGEGGAAGGGATGGGAADNSDDDFDQTVGGSVD